MRDAAQETGGELCTTSIEPQSCIQRVMEDATGYYLLGYEIHSRSNKPELRQIRVKVDRPGVTVSAGNSVLVDPTIGTAEEKRERIAAALASLVDLPACDSNCYLFRPISLGRGSCYRCFWGQTRNTQECGAQARSTLLSLELWFVDRMWWNALARTFMGKCPQNSF